MKKKTQIIILASAAVASAAFYYSKSIKMPDGSEINPIKKAAGGMILGASIGALVIVSIGLFKK